MLNYVLKELMVNTPSNGIPKRCGFTIAEVKSLRDKIDLSPEAYQRFFHADEEWQQNFLSSFFVNEIVIPEIALRLGTGIPKEGILAEVMDGCQRVSTLFAFIDNKISLPDSEELAEVPVPGEDFTYDIRNLTYKTLPIPVRDMFDDYEITAQMYYNLSPERAGYMFVNVLNNTNTLNAQEKRQAVSSAMSRQVQQWSRFNNLDLFETLECGNKLKWVANAEHKRLDVDKTLAETCFMLTSETFTTKGTTGSVIDYYYNQQAKMSQYEFKNSKHIETVLKFVNQSMRNHKTAKNKIALKPLRNYAYIVSRMLKAKIKIDPVNFVDVYLKAIKALCGKDRIQDKSLSGTPYQLRMRGNNKEDTVVALDLLWKEMSRITFNQTQLDSKRTFTREEVLDAYEEQKGICAICGEEMPEFGEDIHGDHFLLYKDGNPTTPDNCDAVHASCNWRK